MKWRKQQMLAIQAIWALEKKNLATRYPWWDLWTILRPVSFGEYLTPLWRASINLSLGLEQLRDWKGSKRTNLDLPWSLRNNAKHPPWVFLRLRILGWAISYKAHVMNWVVREFLMKSQPVDVYEMPPGFENVTFSGWVSWKTKQLTGYITNLWNYHSGFWNQRAYPLWTVPLTYLHQEFMNTHDFYKLNCKALQTKGHIKCLAQSCLCEGTTFVFTKWCAGERGHFTESHVQKIT